MVTPHEMAAALRNFADTGRITKELRKTLRGPVPQVREAIKANAVEILPSAGGFGAWVAAAKITASISSQGLTVVVKLRGGRSSKTGKRSDLRRIDQGTLRHPRWGHRRKGDWFLQAVPPKFFSGPASETDAWRPAVEEAVATAVRSIP